MTAGWPGPTDPAPTVVETPADAREEVPASPPVRCSDRAIETMARAAVEGRMALPGVAGWVERFRADPVAAERELAARPRNDGIGNGNFLALDVAMAGELGVYVLYARMRG